jgi:hypothetical protein
VEDPQRAPQRGLLRTDPARRAAAPHCPRRSAHHPHCRAAAKAPARPAAGSARRPAPRPAAADGLWQATLRPSGGSNGHCHGWSRCCWCWCSSWRSPDPGTGRHCPGPGLAAWPKRESHGRRRCPLPPALRFEEDLIGWGIPTLEEPGKSSIKVTLRTQAAVTRQYRAGSGRARIFLFVHGPVPARRYGQRTVSTPGRIFSHRDLSRMTDHRVPHLVTD